MKSYGKAEMQSGDGPMVSMRTSVLSVLFGKGQGYADAMSIPGHTVLELVETTLDEGISTLEPAAARRAREELAIIREYGSWAAFIEDATRTMRERQVKKVDV